MLHMLKYCHDCLHVIYVFGSFMVSYLGCSAFEIVPAIFAK